MAFGRISRQKWEAMGKFPLPIGTELYDEPISAPAQQVTPLIKQLEISPQVVSPLETKMAQLPISSPIPPLPTLPSTRVIYPPAGQITPAPVSTLSTLPATGLISPPSAILTPQSINPIATPKTVTTTPQSMPLTGALTLEEILALRKIIGSQSGALVAKY